MRERAGPPTPREPAPPPPSAACLFRISVSRAAPPPSPPPGRGQCGPGHASRLCWSSGVVVPPACSTHAASTESVVWFIRFISITYTHFYFTVCFCGCIYIGPVGWLGLGVVVVGDGGGPWWWLVVVGWGGSWFLVGVLGSDME